MSNVKVHSHGNIPFSWEVKPGVSKLSKVIHYDQISSCPIDIRLYALTQTTPTLNADGSSKISVHDKKVPPPPPCSIELLTKRNTSVKGLRLWQDDPFLAAYKECTKNREINGKSSRDGSKNGCSKLLPVVLRKKKVSFSCKDSCDVKDDNLVRLSNLPPLPKNRIRGRQEFV